MLLFALACAPRFPSADSVPSRSAAPRLPENDALRAASASLGPTTRLYVQTDKPLYRPGETVWVRTWQVDAELKVVHDDTVRYVLVGQRGEVLADRLVKQSGGDATNDFVLPPSLPGGVYTVRATGHAGVEAERTIVVHGYQAPRLQKSLEFLRKGYVPGEEVAASLQVRAQTGEALDHRTLDVRVSLDGRDLPRAKVTTNENGEAMVRFRLPDTITDGDGLLTVLVPDAGLTESISRRIPIVLDEYRVRFYPEGGELVEGLSSRVYFTATDATGKPVDLRGRIVDDRGEALASAESTHHGRGRFALSPVHERTYFLEADGRRYPVPAARPDGCVLRSAELVGAADAPVTVDVTCSDLREVLVVGAMRGVRFDAARVRAGRSGARVDLAGAPPGFGVARVTLFSAAGTPLAERVVARARDEVLRLTLTPDRSDYSPRDRVTLDVSATTPSGAPVQADLSVAVVDEALLSFAGDTHGDLLTGLLLESELSGPVENPGSYLDEPTGRALDLLLGTAGWRTFDAPDVVTPRRIEVPDGPMPGRPVAPAPVTVRGAAPPAPAQPVPIVAPEPAPEAPRWAGKAEGILLEVPDEVVMGSLDKSLLDVEIKRKINQIRYCYNRILPRNPTLAGKVTFGFVVEGDGSVSAVSVKTSTLNSPKVEQCVMDRLAEMRFLHPGGGQIRVTYPFVFRPGWEVVVPDYAPVRVFPEPEHLPGPRTDFRDTVAWAPLVRTDEAGHARVTFTLSDAVTAFRALAQGIGGGFVGRGERVFASKLPFDLSVTLPVAGVQGDLLHLPVTLTNRRDRPVTVHLDPALGAPAKDVTLAAHSGETIRYDLAVDEATDITIRASAEGLSDAVTRPLPVMRAGYPRTWGTAGTLDHEVQHGFELPDAIGDARAWVKVYPDTLASIVDGLDAMLTLPHGCFEQISSANYPNLLVLRYLQERGVVNHALAQRTHALLEEGYKRIAAYESPGGGFEWYGAAHPHPVLTAYGIDELTDMRAVYPGVDGALIDRALRWLYGQRDGRGGWREDARATTTLPGGEQQRDAYITWALVDAGLGARLPLEVAAQARLARETDDDYLLALATGSLDGAARRAANAKLAARQRADGAWANAADSATRSGGRNLLIETTALATLALAKDPTYASAVERATGWLVGQRQPGGGWGATQSTVLALKALVAAQKTQPTRRPGSVEVRVDGQPAGTIRWDEGEGAPPRLEVPLAVGHHEVTVTRPGGGVLPYVVGASWTSWSPPPVPGVRVGITTRLGAEKLGMGEPVRLTAEISNPGDSPVSMPIARIGVPACLSTQPWQLEDLRTRGAVDFYEAEPTGVVMYFRSLPARTTRTVTLDLLASVPGSCTSAPSSAWLYYDDDLRAVAAPVRVEVD